jgi:hypothetical protein
MNESLNKFLSQNKTKSFRELLFSFIDRSGLKDSDVYRKAGIDRRLFSKVRCNENYVLCKENILKLCVSLRLNLDDTSKLLESAGYSLSTTNNYDLILRYCIINKIYDIDTVCGYLFDYGTIK